MNVRYFRSITLATFALLALAACQAEAGLVVYSGVDAGATPGTSTPLSNAAATTFDAAAFVPGTNSLVNFESATLGTFTSLTIAPGVTLTQTGGGSAIRNSQINTSFPALYGFNTTASGAKFVDIEGSTITFTFAAPIQSFGAYFTGVQNFNPDTLTFSDGTAQTVTLPVPPANGGGVEFVGFTDLGASISSVTVNAGSDAIGLDDLRFGTFASVPEPATVTMMATGLAALAGLLRLRRRRAVA